MDRVKDRTSPPQGNTTSTYLATSTADDVDLLSTPAGTLVLEDQYGTYALRFADLENQLQHRMARWAADHLAQLTDNVKRNGNHLRQQVHSDCTSTIADLTATNRSLIEALQFNFLYEMADQITEAMINEKREFHALVGHGHTN